MASCLIRTIEIKHQDNNFGRGYFGALQIDFLFTTNPVFKEIEAHYATTLPFNNQQIRTVTVEGLIILKLYALPSLYRQGNFAKVGIYENDIATLMQAYEPDKSAVLAHLSPHFNPADMHKIQVILQEIEGRIARFQRNLNE